MVIFFQETHGPSTEQSPVIFRFPAKVAGSSTSDGDKTCQQGRGFHFTQYSVILQSVSARRSGDVQESGMVYKAHTGTLAIFFFSCLFMASPVMADSTRCLKCHQDMIDAATVKLVVHNPFFQHKCSLCHGVTADQVISETTEQEDLDNERGKIEWLAESFGKSTLQVALLPADTCNSELTMKLWYQNREKQQSQIHCPDLDTIPTKLGTAQRPTVSLLQLRNYNAQLFTRTTLHWTTNVPCRCQLTYRSDEHEYTEHEDDFYTVVHHQEIRNFNPANTQISIECDDTFEQHTQAPFIPLTQLPHRKTKTDDLATQELAGFSVDFKRINDQVEISVATNQPAAVALGRVEQQQTTTQTVIPQIPGIQDPDTGATANHPPLSDKEQVNTTICFQCHKETVEVASHPINVTAPPGMIIPPEYPLLADGRITCMTCHSRHSSDNEARLIKEGKKELCTGCHTNY